MKTQVTVFDQDGLPAQSVIVEAGENRAIELVSQYLISAGQKYSISVGARPLAPRGLAEICSDIRMHVQASPTHGYNCICMDNLIREMRGMIREHTVTAGPHSHAPEDNMVGVRLRYVLETALRHA